MSLENPSEENIQLAIECFWETFPPIWHRMRGNIRGIAVENSGISMEQFHILRQLFRGNGSVSELADAKQISRAAISQAVNVLVGKGLIVRKTNKDDRRFIQLELTPQGRELITAIFKRNRAWMVKKLVSLENNELESIHLWI